MNRLPLILAAGAVLVPRDWAQAQVTVLG